MPEQTADQKTPPTPVLPVKHVVAATTLKQKEALDALVGERAYQETRWNSATTPSGGQHSAAEFLLFMENYLAEAKAIITRESDATGLPKILHITRKVGALALASMEQNGVYVRAKS